MAITADWKIGAQNAAFASIDHVLTLSGGCCRREHGSVKRFWDDATAFRIRLFGHFDIVCFLVGIGASTDQPFFEKIGKHNCTLPHRMAISTLSASWLMLAPTRLSLQFFGGQHHCIMLL